MQSSLAFKKFFFTHSYQLLERYFTNYLLLVVEGLLEGGPDGGGQLLLLVHLGNGGGVQLLLLSRFSIIVKLDNF